MRTTLDRSIMVAFAFLLLTVANAVLTSFGEAKMNPYTCDTTIVNCPAIGNGCSNCVGSQQVGTCNKVSIGFCANLDSICSGTDSTGKKCTCNIFAC